MISDGGLYNVQAASRRAVMPATVQEAACQIRPLTMAGDSREGAHPLALLAELEADHLKGAERRQQQGQGRSAAMGDAPSKVQRRHPQVNQSRARGRVWVGVKPCR